MSTSVPITITDAQLPTTLSGTVTTTPVTSPSGATGRVRIGVVMEPASEAIIPLTQPQQIAACADVVTAIQALP